MEKRVLAFDFGASSGRAMLATFDGKKIELKEVHRFSNDPVTINGTVYWDIQRLFFEIKQGGFDSIGIDTWGVDFGLLRKDGTLVENPVHYRDKRNSGMIEKAEEYISKEKMYDITGIQFMDFNTVFQLLSLKENRPYILDEAETMLFTPDLLNYMLTGVNAIGIGEASGMFPIDSSIMDYDKEMKEKFNSLISAKNLPWTLEEVLPKVLLAGENAGALTENGAKLIENMLQVQV